MVDSHDDFGDSSDPRVAQLAEYHPRRGTDVCKPSCEKVTDQRRDLDRNSTTRVAENKGEALPCAGRDGNPMGVKGSNPFPGTKFFLWKSPVGLSQCPYIWRWVLFPSWYSLRLHWWTNSDDKRAYHNHAWWFIVILLWGSYVDFSDDGPDLLRIGSIRFRRANHAHTVQILKPTLTLLITGRPLWRWGFRVNGKIIKRDKYFAVYGHHPCEDGQEPIRLRPDRTRIE